MKRHAKNRLRFLRAALAALFIAPLLELAWRWLKHDGRWDVMGQVSKAWDPDAWTGGGCER